MVELQIDLLQEGDHLLLEISVPGVLESDIDLTLEGSHLTLRADRPPPPGLFLHREIERGILVRVLDLPYAVDLLRSSYEDGVLRIDLKRRAKS